MSTQLATQNDWSKPTSTAEAFSIAEKIAKSDLAPTSYKGKPANCLIAMQMGAEVGLSPMQAIQNIAVINCRPSLWGDALLGLCQGHPSFRGIEEKVSKDKAICTVKRDVNGVIQTHTAEFSIEEAKIAGLLGRDPWKKYPKRMLQMRARGFALRDMFADVLKGIHCAEEVSDYAKDITVNTVVTKKQVLGEKLGIPGVQHESAQEVAAEPENARIAGVDEIPEDCTEEVAKKAKILEKILDENHLQELRTKWLNKKGVGCFEEFAESDLDYCIEKVQAKIAAQKQSAASEFDAELAAADNGDNVNG